MKIFILFLGALCVAGGSMLAEEKRLTVSAAASLKEPLTELAKPAEVILNFGASGALAQQIENGAPVDVFISANVNHMDALQAKNRLLSGSRRDFLKNEIVLIAPLDSALKGFENLTDPAIKRIAIGEPKSVPVGAYAQEVFTKLNLLEALKSKLIFALDTRQVLASVESRNADAGVVYVTDAKTSSKVRVVATAPAGSHAAIVYPIAIIATSPHPAEAQTFVNTLFAPDATRIFEKYGFVVAH